MTFPRRWPLLITVLTLALLVAVLFSRSSCFGNRPPLIPAMTRVDTVHDTVAVAGRPNPVPPHGIGKVVHATVPVAGQLSSGTPDTARVRAFARKVFEAESLRAVLDSVRRAGGDTTRVSHPSGILPPTALRYDGRKLDLWLSRSDGRVLHAESRVAPRWEVTAGQGGRSDSVPLVVSDRAWVRAVREVKKCTPPSLILALGGALLNSKDRGLGAALGAGAGLLGCMAD